MDNTTGLSASDVALLNNDNMGGFGGMIWLFAILALMGGGFGGWGNNGYNNGNLDQDINRGFDNQNALANQREILASVTSGTAQSVAATNQSFHDTISALGDKYNELQRDIAAVQVGQAQALANQNECCCTTKMEIMQNRYDDAMNTASINANTTAQTQKILDAIQQNKIEDLQAKVSALELQNATQNVVRYPSSWTYNAGVSPFCNGGCGCGCMGNMM